MTDWVPYGDVGVFAEFGSVEQADRIQATIVELLPHAHVRRGWSSLLVLGDPDRLPRELAGVAPGAGPVPVSAPRIHKVPVRYDGADLATVADACGLTTVEVIERHIATEYQVVMLGFTRAFPYLTGLDPMLHVPRRATPRSRVAAGSVAIAGAQCGIYPSDSPGGWHLLGRTEVAVFDVRRRPAALFSPGDRITFTMVV